MSMGFISKVVRKGWICKMNRAIRRQKFHPEMVLPGWCSAKDKQGRMCDMNQMLKGV